MSGSIFALALIIVGGASKGFTKKSKLGLLYFS
jgi:hypothetical protein